MNKDEQDRRTAESERYLNAMHRLGRAGTFGAILVMLGIPTAMGLYFDALPAIGQIFQAALPLLIVFLPSNLFEIISYTPILGSSVYLALITGEVLNLKLPVVNSVLQLMSVETGTQEADVIATITVCVTAFVTIAIITLGIVMMIPLQPVLTSAAVKTAASYILSALFGALGSGVLGRDLGGGIKAYGRLRGMIAPCVFMVALVLWDQQISVFLHLDKLMQQDGQGVILHTLQGFVLVLMVLLTYLSNKWLYANGFIRVDLPDEPPRGKGSKTARPYL
ncbi:MAG: hypothetical protein LBQ16_01595 [Gracilibacteraceae bacterium]|jgi:hypothetical protein|nr:hypothetical protein [Gracilibacteraceae bacterium]